jgi:hypothetical protein
MALLNVMLVIAVTGFQKSQEFGQHFRHIPMTGRFKVQDTQPLREACMKPDIEWIF